MRPNRSPFRFVSRGPFIVLKPMTLLGVPYGSGDILPEGAAPFRTLQKLFDHRYIGHPDDPAFVGSPVLDKWREAQARKPSPPEGSPRPVEAPPAPAEPPAATEPPREPEEAPTASQRASQRTPRR